MHGGRYGRRAGGAPPAGAASRLPVRIAARSASTGRRTPGGPVEYRILGPLEVVSSPVRVRLGQSREQNVLVALLLDANRVVPLARLVDAVWDDDPPQAAVKAIRNCVSALRRRFVEAGATDEIIATDPAGYVLRVHDGELDAQVFALTVAEARRLALSGNLGRGAARLRAALAHWR